MSEENVEFVRRGYALQQDAYRSGSLTVEKYLPVVEELWHPDIVFKTADTFIESGEWHGREAVLRFVVEQAAAFEEMWIEPEEFIDAGTRIIVPVRFGGPARHTGIDVTFSYVHVFTVRDGKIARIDVYESKQEALEAAELSE